MILPDGKNKKYINIPPTIANTNATISHIPAPTVESTALDEYNELYIFFTSLLIFLASIISHLFFVVNFFI